MPRPPALPAARRSLPLPPALASTFTYSRRLPTRSITPLSSPPDTNSAATYSTRLNSGLLSTHAAKMSTMPASHGHNEACCNIPPVVSSGYTAKGAYVEIDGFKAYTTGPEDATKGIVVIYDIFGYFEQTLQGADILATSDDHHKYRVVIPDWFKGEPVRPLGSPPME